MKYNPERNVISSTNTSKKCGMEINEKSFSILTSGIYQDKIKAIVREYSTNALDSHIEARNDLPFEVHLPTRNESYFYVRDYGLGLDDTEIEDVYCTLFKSTKDTTNELNGCLGIGASSGYSYNTKSFIVESWKNGYHYIYSCFIGIEGIPSYSQLLKEFSQDAEGVKVQIVVDKDDIDEFYNSAHEVYKWFSLKPNFIGQQLEIENPVIEKYKDYSIANRCYAIMGNIAYPIDHHYSLNNYIDIIDSKICIYFDIGEISFNPSRESLEYSDRTLHNLENKFKLVIEEIKTNIQNKIQNCKSEWEAICEYNTLVKTYGGIKNIIKHIGNKCEYNGKELLIKEIKLPCIYFPGYKNGKLQQSLTLSSKYKYVINDLKIGSLCRCKELSRSYEVYLINKDHLEKVDITYTDDCFINASTLPKPARTYVSQNRSKLTSFMKVENTRLKTTAYVACEVDKAVSKYYIVRKGYDVIYNKLDNPIPPRDLHSILTRIGIKEDVYSVSSKEEKKLLELGFKHIRDVVEETIETDYQQFIKEIDFYSKYRALSSFTNSSINIFNKIATYKRYISKTSKLNELITLQDWLNNKSNSDKYVHLQNLYHKLCTCGKDIKFSSFPVDNYLAIVKMYEPLTLGRYDPIPDSFYEFYLKGIDS